ncbi:MAG: RDD family protein [Balneola sp.]
MAQIGIETAQHVKINYNPAGIFERILAYLVDFLVLGIYWTVLMMISTYGTSIVPGDSGGGNDWILYVIVLLPVMLYHLTMEIIWNGYTVGKWLIGIRVVKLDGTRPSVSNYLIRWLIRLFEITMTSGVVAFFTLLLNGKGQRLGDIAAKTCVIKVGRRTKLSDTVFENIEDEYDATFPQVVELTDKEISVVNDVLKSRNGYDKAAWLTMVARTRVLIQEKTGILNSGMGDIEFLKQVVKDYNALHGRVE